MIFLQIQNCNLFDDSLNGEIKKKMVKSYLHVVKQQLSLVVHQNHTQYENKNIINSFLLNLKFPR